MYAQGRMYVLRFSKGRIYARSYVRQKVVIDTVEREREERKERESSRFLRNTTAKERTL
jgi:hypothetical protein